MIDKNNPYKWQKTKGTYISPAGRFRAFRNSDGTMYNLYDTETGEVTIHPNLKWAERYALRYPGRKDCRICRSCAYYSLSLKCEKCQPEYGTWELSEYRERKTEFVRVTSSGGYYRYKKEHTV